MTDWSPIYSAGTVTVGAGGTTVNGSGTTWDTIGLRAGDQFRAQGLSATIVAVVSNTQLTIKAWAGAAIAGGNYEIMRVSDADRLIAANAELAANMVPNLTAFGQLSGSPDKVVYFLGPGAPALSPLTAAARQLLSEASFPAMLGRLGLGSMALQDASAVGIAGGSAVLNSLAVESSGINYVVIGSTGANSLGRGLRFNDQAGGAAAYIIATPNSVGTNALVQFYVGGGLEPDIKMSIDDDGLVNIAERLNVNGLASFDEVSIDGGDGMLLRGSTNPFVANANGLKVYYQTNLGIATIGPISSGAETSMQLVTSNGGVTTTKMSIAANGAVSIPGSLSKGSGTFLIDHPLDPENRDLAHGFVEAPRYELIYRGTATLVAGRATVDIDAASTMTPGTFAALTTNAVVQALQNQEGFARLRPGPVAGGVFDILCEDETCTDEVAWMVVAERNDPFVRVLDDNCDGAGRFIPEREKEMA